MFKHQQLTNSDLTVILLVLRFRRGDLNKILSGSSVNL